MCNKCINLMMNDLFIIHGTHKWSNINNIDTNKRNLIHNILYDERQIKNNKINELVPNIKKIYFFMDLINY